MFHISLFLSADLQSTLLADRLAEFGQLRTLSIEWMSFFTLYAQSSELYPCGCSPESLLATQAEGSWLMDSPVSSVPTTTPAATPFTKHANVSVPLICGPMYPCSNPQLVSAVSEAGGHAGGKSSLQLIDELGDLNVPLACSDFPNRCLLMQWSNT